VLKLKVASLLGRCVIRYAHSMHYHEKLNIVSTQQIKTRSTCRTWCQIMVYRRSGCLRPAVRSRVHSSLQHIYQQVLSIARYTSSRPKHERSWTDARRISSFRDCHRDLCIRKAAPPVQSCTLKAYWPLMHGGRPVAGSRIAVCLRLCQHEPYNWCRYGTITSDSEP
jgi:hypothetical protein